MVFSQNVVFSHSDQPSSQEPEQRALATGKKACESEQTMNVGKKKKQEELAINQERAYLW